MKTCSKIKYLLRNVKKKENSFPNNQRTKVNILKLSIWMGKRFVDLLSVGKMAFPPPMFNQAIHIFLSSG